MTAEQLSALERVVRDAGSGWILDAVKTSDPHYEFLGARLEQLMERARERGIGALGLTPEEVVAAYGKSPQKVRAFIQALGETRTPDMLIMVWRILQGMATERLTVHYILEQEFHMEITLRSPYDDAAETYLSNDIDDLALVRHFGISKMNGRPLVDGFYPLRSS